VLPTSNRILRTAAFLYTVVWAKYQFKPRSSREAKPARYLPGVPKLSLKMNKRLFFPLFAVLLISIPSLNSQPYFDVDQSVKLSAEVNRGPATITVNWIEDPRTISYDLYRREYGAEGWGTKVGNYPANVTQYIDADVEAEKLYEYKIEKFVDGVEGYGYVLSGIEIPAVHQAGELLIVITTQTLAEVSPELEEYRSVLETDGWASRLLVVEEDDPVSAIKGAILAAHSEVSFTAIFLLGDVPVPHSGDIKPDAHPTHRGAWAADCYYGDLDGIWTDTVVNITQSDNPRNHNVPGDGNWDQSFLPSNVEVAVGRADFSELPVFVEDEFTLLRAYLRKDVDFRTKVFSVSRRAAVRNTNPWLGALGQNGIRNFSPLVGAENISYDTWEDVFEQDYLWYYAAGGGGYSRLGGAGNSLAYSQRSFQAIFTGWFGSYFGDYHSENNYMRSALASGTTLSAAWVGAPHWHFHTMGMGFPLAHATTVTQNNDTIYTADFFPRGVHVNLLGDPTLKTYIVAPPTNLAGARVQGKVELAWSPSVDPVDRYYIYRRDEGEVAFTLVDSTQLGTTNYTDASPLPGAGTYRYLVRAAKLETTPSGSFYNLSAGTATSIEVATGIAEPYSRLLALYPNPTSAEVTIRATDRIARIVVLTAGGAAIVDQSGGDQLEAHLDVSGLRAGVYLTLVYLPDGVARRRLIVL